LHKIYYVIINKNFQIQLKEIKILNKIFYIRY
jgi:hypothetical protein